MAFAAVQHRLRTAAVDYSRMVVDRRRRIYLVGGSIRWSATVDDDVKLVIRSLLRRGRGWHLAGVTVVAFTVNSVNSVLSTR